MRQLYNSMLDIAKKKLLCFTQIDISKVSPVWSSPGVFQRVRQIVLGIQKCSKLPKMANTTKYRIAKLT